MYVNFNQLHSFVQFCSKALRSVSRNLLRNYNLIPHNNGNRFDYISPQNLFVTKIKFFGNSSQTHRGSCWSEEFLMWISLYVLFPYASGVQLNEP
jgi:hypothetical protein